MSEKAPDRSPHISLSWFVLLGVLLILELGFLLGAYSSGVGGPERVFGVFTGLLIVTFGVVLYTGRLIFYD